MKQLYKKLPALLLTLIVGLMATSTAFASTIVIQNDDGPGVGFNDSTPASPVGGNSGTTVGQQRLNAFQYAANIWGATLVSGPTITIRASWLPLTCTATSGTLGSAGAITISGNFPGAVFTNTWYSAALANALSNSDLDVSNAEINATFNRNLGTTGCLETLHWYYGLDTNTDTNGINLVTVLLHEFSHGLGFQTFTDKSTGVQPSSFPSIYDRFLFDNTTNKTWPQMTDAERAASAINTNNLVWNGPQVVSDVPGVLGTPRLRVNSPPAIAGNYQVGTADFGAPLTTSGVTAGVVQALDLSDGAGVLTTDACSPLTNAGAVSGNIALIDRGTCTFVVKVKNAQNAGAIGVIIADNVAGSPPPGLGGSDPTITIPAVQITLADGNTIKTQLGSGVNATLLIDGSAPVGADASGRPRMYAPNPLVGGSSVSHWDTSLSPNQLMEPNINNDLSHSVTPPQDLTFSLMRDIGWCSGVCPTPSPTPTPSPPANNDFANAQIISGCFGSVAGTNVGATKETAEPAHAGDAGGASVWYQWQASENSSVTIDTAGSDYDTLLAVYTGNSVSGLTQVASNDDEAFPSVLTSKVVFNAVSGTVYRIAIDGWSGLTGNITLNWRLSSLRIDSMNPRAGRTSGGQQVLLTGAFSGLSTVTMGGVSASWVYTNGGGDTSAITVTTPAHSVGAVQISLSPLSGCGYPQSNAFAYLPTVFTDDTILVGVTTAKAQHIIELRQAIDAMRAVAGLAPAPWTDDTLTPNSIIIKAIHIQELRTYLDGAANLLGYSTSPYTDPGLSSGFVIKRVHIEELRQRIRTIAG